jgi:hypothetical protein
MRKVPPVRGAGPLEAGLAAAEALPPAGAADAGAAALAAPLDLAGPALDGLGAGEDGAADDGAACPPPQAASKALAAVDAMASSAWRRVMNRGMSSLLVLCKQPKSPASDLTNGYSIYQP